MEHGLIVLVSLAMMNPTVTAQENFTTMGEVYFERFEKHFHDDAISLEDLTTPLDYATEAVHYSQTLVNNIALDFALYLEELAVQSLYDDLNDHCSEYLQTPIEDLTDEITNTGCVIRRLWGTLTLKLKAAVKLGVEDFSFLCDELLIPFCSSVDRNCTRQYEERVGKLLSRYLEDVLIISNIQELDAESSIAPIDVIAELFVNNTDLLRKMFVGAHILESFSSFFASVPSTENFSFENLLRPWKKSAITQSLINHGTNTEPHDELSWGIVKSNSGRSTLPCSIYRDIYSRDSVEYQNIFPLCYRFDIFQSFLDILICAHNDSGLGTLRWLPAPPVYFHSQCICLASNGGADCGVEAPRGVDPRHYCLSVLLRDFQRRVWYRPAVTYLDYASHTRVPACNFSNFLTVTFRDVCDDRKIEISLKLMLSMQCFLKGLVNKDLNCSETLTVTTYDPTHLCRIKNLLELVLCDDHTDDDVHVPFYEAGDSMLVLILTYVDVVLRVLTLVTFVACPQLRNLPGKLLICYMMTALLRLVLLRSTLADMTMAVRLDVATDLASTFWLFSYLHFLTVSIKTLRLPDSLSPDEVRMVLLRYALLGWVLPMVLSAVFFWMDEVIDSRLQFGQLLFVLCNYMVLIGNLIMCYQNCSFYYDVKNNARQIQRGVTARSVFAAIFNFALKTSVLSGAGIIFRLIFTQIHGVELLLGIYHVLGTLQGLLLFLLYGCNREARAFWSSVLVSALRHFRRPRNTSQHTNSLELEQNRGPERSRETCSTS